MISYRFLYIRVDGMGAVFLNQQPMANMAELYDHCSLAARRTPQPDVYLIPAAEQDNFEAVGKVIFTVVRAGFDDDKIRFFNHAQND